MDAKLMKHGMFGWFELQTRDVAAAKKFYGALFGWTTAEMDVPGMPYTVVSSGGEEIAGMMTIPAEAREMPPCWGIYISVDDVDASVRQAGSLGAAVVVPPTDIPSVGRFAVLRDPQGAVFSVITYLRR